MKALVLSLVLALRAQEQGPRGIGLTEAFSLALKRSEELAQRGEGVAELEAREGVLWSQVKPRLSLLATELLQDVPPDPGGVSARFGQRSREQAQLSLRQPLFSGLREYLAVRSARLRTASAELALRRAEDLLYQDVARATLDLLLARREILVRQALLGITQDRIKELKARERLGRSRTSEVLAAESRKAQIEADLEGAGGRERVFQLRLGFLTGLEEELSPFPLPLPAEEALEGFLRKASGRPDVESARRERQALGLAARIAGRARWPTLGLDGNYYLKRPPGFQDQIKWDVLLALQLPLYSGGEVSARAREAEAAERSQGQAEALALRRAQLEVRSAHRDLASALASVRALEKAERLSEANAKAQAEDYRLGLVTNLEVLEATNSLQEARLRLEEARAEACWSRVRLEVAAGRGGGG